MAHSKIAPLSYTSRTSQNNNLKSPIITTFIPGFHVLVACVTDGTKSLVTSRGSDYICNAGYRSGSVAQRVEAFICFTLPSLPKFGTLPSVLCLSRHLFHFAVDFVTLSYTKMTIIFLPLLGGASQCSPLCMQCSRLLIKAEGQ